MMRSPKPLLYTLIIVLKLTNLLPLTAQNSVSVLGWSKDGKVALSVTYANARGGSDASYFLVDLINDRLLVQFDEMANTSEAASQLLSDRWRGTFSQQMRNHSTINGSGQRLEPTFNHQNRRFSLKLSNRQLILHQGNTQKLLASNLDTNAQLIGCYLSPHESRIVMVLLANNQIQIVGSHLLVGFK